MNISKQPLKRIIVWPCTMCEDDDMLWIYHGRLNALFRYSFATSNLELVSVLDDENPHETPMCKIFKIRSKIYMIPFWGNHLHIYNIEKNEQNIIPLRLENEYDEKRFFCNAFLNKGIITCVPANYHSIVRIDTENDKLVYLMDLKKEFMKYGINDVDLNDADIDKNGIIYGVVSSTNKYVKIDLDENIICVKSVVDTARLSNIRIINDDVFVSTYNDNSPSREIVRLRDNRVVSKYTEPIILKSLKNHLLIDSLNGDWLEELDPDGKIVRRTEEVIEEFPIQYSFKFGCVESGKYADYYFSRRDYQLKTLTQNGAIARQDKLTCEVESKLLWEFRDGLDENEIFDLGVFIDMVNKG